MKGRKFTYDRKLGVESEHYRRPNGQFGKGGWKKTKNPSPQEGKSNLASKRIKKATPEICKKIDDALRSKGLIKGDSRVLPPDRILISQISPHAQQRFADRNATKAMAQHYVDTAFIRIQESPDKYAYIAGDGTSVVIENGKLITVIPRKDYNPDQERRLEVILEWMN